MAVSRLDPADVFSSVEAVYFESIEAGIGEMYGERLRLEDPAGTVVLMDPRYKGWDRPVKFEIDVIDVFPRQAPNVLVHAYRKFDRAGWVACCGQRAHELNYRGGENLDRFYHADHKKMAPGWLWRALDKIPAAN